jgi:hypothetical protein
MRRILIFFVTLTSAQLFAQQKTDTFLEDILSNNTDSIMTEVLKNPASYRLQIIYTKIDRDRKNRPHFQNYYFNCDRNLYFNPASTVKLPLAALALEKLSRLKREGVQVDRNTSMLFDSSFAGQTIEWKDSTSQTGFPSIGHFIKKALLVSDNDAYNRLYQFLGQSTIQRKMIDKGYHETRITRQFMGFTPEQNRHTNTIRFIRENGQVIWTQPPAYNVDTFRFPKEVKMGKAHWNSKDSLVNEPIDFTKANNMPLEDLHKMLRAIIFPGSFSRIERFDLTDDDYAFLLQYLSQFPSETNYPKYDSSVYYNGYVKFFFRDTLKNLPSGVRVFNKVGWAYGFITDASYVADFTNKVEYMLSATLYVNSDGILNDNRYDYDSIGFPFMRALGETIYHYELQRHRKFKPDLSAFKMPYESRDPADNRPTIKEVDN